jgi:hypothetical protein
VFARKPVECAGIRQEEVVGWVKVAGGGEDVQASEGVLEGLGCGREVVAGDNGQSGEETKLGQVWGDPVDQRYEAGSEESDSFVGEQFPARCGAKDWVKDDGDSWGEGADAGKEVDHRGYDRGSREHPDLDPCGWQVALKAV